MSRSVAASPYIGAIYFGLPRLEQTEMCVTILPFAFAASKHTVGDCERSPVDEALDRLGGHRMRMCS